MALADCPACYALSSYTSSFLILRSGGSSAVVGSPLASLGRGSSVLMRRLGWEEGGGGGGGESGWGAAGRRLRFFFFFFFLLVLLLDDDSKFPAPPSDQSYPSQSGMEIHPSSRYTMQGRYMCHRRPCVCSAARRVRRGWRTIGASSTFYPCSSSFLILHGGWFVSPLLLLSSPN